MIENLLRPTHWHLSESYFQTVGLHALKLIEAGKSLDSLKVPAPKRNFDANIIQSAEDADNFSFRTLRNEEGQHVALIPVYGAMTKYGGFCSYGTAELASMIDEANRNKDIFSGIVIDTDTPGGAGDAIEVLERAIDQSELPIVAYIDRMAASLGQWMISAVAKKGGAIIVDSLNNTIMGSIGSYIMYQNIAARLEKEGVKVEIIRAPQSVDKVKFNSIEEVTPEIRAEIKEDLKIHTNIFIEAIKANYGERLKKDTDKLFTGGTFSGAKAIEIGLADRQGTISDAFNEVLKMASNTQSQSIYNENMNTFKRLGLSFSIAQKLSAEELEKISEAGDKLAEMEQLKELNGTLTEQVSTLEQSISDLNTAHNAALKEQTDKVSEMQTQLDETPAAAASTAVSEKDESAEAVQAEQNKKYETSFDKRVSEVKSNLKLSK